MGDLVEYILEHEQGGTGVLNMYTQFLVGLDRYNRYVKLMEDEHDPVNLKELAEMPNDGFLKAYLNSRFLMELGWGNLPRIREDYDTLFVDGFPEGYIGVDVPEELADKGSKIISRADLTRVMEKIVLEHTPRS